MTTSSSNQPSPPREAWPLVVLHGARSTSWFGPYADEDEARMAARRIATVGDSLGVREATIMGRARYTSALEGIEFAPLPAPRRRRIAY